MRVLYNDDELAFMLEVHDRTDSRPGEETSMQIHDRNLEMHSDAFAVQLPKADAFQTAPVVVKPLYRHGDSRHPSTMWYWSAGSVEPEEAPRTALLDASGPNQKIVPREGDASLMAQGEWKHGRWRVIMKRPRDGGDLDVSFNEGDFIPVSFANWDGNNGEIGAKHTLTTWYWLVLPSQPNPVKEIGLPLGIALGMFFAGIVLVRSQRKTG